MTELRDKKHANEESVRKQIAFNIDPHLHSTIKIAATERGKTIKEYMLDAVAREMEEDAKT